MRLPKLSRMILLFAIFLILAVSGCGGEEAAPDPDLPGEPAEVEGPARDTLTIALGRDFYYGPEDRTYLHGSTNVWESLVYLDDNLKAIPWLADNFYSSEDGLIWVFELKEGVEFHDGSVMDAETVRDNLLRLSRHPGTSQPYSELVEIRATGPLTVEVELAVPMPAFPEMISYFPSAIFSSDVLNNENRGLLAPVGTGPYTFANYGNDEITLKAFDNYRAGKPAVETVIFKYVPDENTRVSALLAGEVDALADVGVVLPEQVPLIAGNPEIEILTVDVLTTIYMHYQTQSGPFNSAELRCAVAMLLNRDEIVELMLDGFGTPARGFITPLADFWVNPAAAPTYDPAQAAEIIEGYLDGSGEVEILINSNWARRWPVLSIAQYLQTELAKVGLDAVINSLETGAYNDAVRAGDYHITFTPWTGSDPDDFFRTWIFSTGSFNNSRGLLYSNAAADELITRAASEMDREERRKIYFELQENIAEEAPMSPIYHDMTVYAVRSYVQNFSMDFNFKLNLHAVTLE